MNKTPFYEMGAEYSAERGRIRASGYTQKNRLDQLWSMLENERSTWDSHWRDLADFILPRRVRFNLSDRNKGDKRNNRIINNTATLAARTLRSGMMAGVTSPARPWFKLTTYDPATAEQESVKLWLHDVTRLMNAVLTRSNIYNSLPTVYGDIGTFGTAAMGIFEDADKIIRTTTMPLGSYVLSNNERGIVDVFGREMEMSVRQIVHRFGMPDPAKPGNEINWEYISTTVRNLWNQSNFEANVPVRHFIIPNDNYDSHAFEAKYKRYKSCYFEKGESEHYLNESGFDEFPIMCPRWDVLGEDAYGTSPGMDALGDTKSLQVLERRKAQAIEKTVNPPMTGPSSLRNQKSTILAGDITYVDTREGQQGFRAAHEVNFPVKEVMMDVQEHQQRIQRAFYEDLFLMLTLSDRREITAREVDERHEEKLLMLGPVLERLNDELLDPTIDRTFGVMNRRGMIPRPPLELEPGQPLKVEYISIMAQAQKMVASGTMERFATFTNAVAEVNPTIFDKVDMDQMMDEYGDMLGIPPRIIRSDDRVEEIRAQRAEQAKQQQQAENVANAAKAAKSLGSTPMDTNSALDKVVAGMSQ